MLSVILSVRNSHHFAANCLASLIHSFRATFRPEDVEFILVDDDSDPRQQIVQLFQDFRGKTSSPVKIVRFKQRRYYGWGLAYGLSAARGSDVLFVSHDMIVTPDYLRGVTAVAGLDEDFGIIRGTASFVDGYPQHQFSPPFPPRNMGDLLNFSSYVSNYHGLAWEEDSVLTGDAMLIKRAVIKKIGVFDTRFPFGYFSDVDYGLRAQRAGFKLVCAKGAWLHHEGAAAYKDESATKNLDIQVVHANRMQMVQACYVAFRDKWDQTLPEAYSGLLHEMGLSRHRLSQPAGTADFQPPVPLDDPVAEIL